MSPLGPSRAYTYVSNAGNNARDNVVDTSAI